jgi:ribosomal protein L9
MPLILKGKTDRAAIQFARMSALRATDEVVQQLQDQMAAAHRQLTEATAELTKTKYELAELRYQIAKRDREEAFAAVPSPSTSIH